MKSFCAMTGLSWASYYRWQRRPVVSREMEEMEEMELRDEIQRIALQYPSYGYRPMTAELQRSKVVHIRGDSYRLKEKRQARSQPLEG